MLLYGSLQLLYILSAPFPKCCLCLTVPLFTFLRGRIDLCECQLSGASGRLGWSSTGFRPPFRFCTWAGSWVKLCSSGSGEDSEKDSSSKGSIFGTGGTSSMLDIPTYRQSDRPWRPGIRDRLALVQVWCQNMT